MGVTAWSRNPDDNGTVDPLIRASDGAAARDYQRGQRGIMAAIKRLADDHGGALTSSGINNAYTVQTYGGSENFHLGSSLAFVADRANTGPASLNVDGFGTLALRDRNGAPLLPNALKPGRLARIFYDPTGPFWRLEGLEVVKNDDFDPAPPNTIKGNDGQGLSDLTVDAARVLLEIDHVTNKSEEEMVAEGAIADALALKATPANITDALGPVIQSIDAKASKQYVDGAVAPIISGFSNLQEDVGELSDEVEVIRNGQNAGNIIAETWAQLAAITPTLNARAEIPGTAVTTHVDPVAAGNPTVLDPGVYRGSISPLGWKRIGATTAAAAAETVGKSIGSTTLPLNSRFGVVLRDRLTGELADLSNPDSIAWIQEIAVPTTYPTDLTNVVLTETSSVVLGDDTQRSGDLLIQIIDKADAGFNFSANPAALDTPGTWTQKAGQWINHGDVGTKTVSGVVRRVAGDSSSTPLSVKINVRVRRRVNAPPPTSLADAIFVRWQDPVDQRFKDVLRTEIDYLYGLNILPKIKVWFLPGASRANNMVNLANPNGPLFIAHDGASGAIETQPYKFMKGNGVDQYIDTQLLPADIGQTLDGHFLAAKTYPGGGTSSTGIASGNSSTYGIQPDRGTNLYGFRSGSTTEVNDTTQPNYLWAALNRDQADAGNLSGFVDGVKIFTKPRVLTALPTRTLNILASNASGGFTSPSPLSVHGVVAANSLSDLSISRVIASNKRIQAVMATIAGA